MGVEWRCMGVEWSGVIGGVEWVGCLGRLVH